MIKIEEIQEILNTTKTPPEFSKEILAKVAELESAKKDDKEVTVKAKNQFVVFSKGETPDTVAHIFQVSEEDDLAMVLDKIRKSAIEHNLSCKKKSNLVTTFDDVVHIKRKHSKEAGYQLKTKADWVRMIVLTPEMERLAEVIAVD